jgi:hypothetical protein
MIKLSDILKEIRKVLSEIKIEYKDKPYSDGNFTPIKTKIKYNNSDIDGVILKLLIGEGPADSLTVIYPYVSDPDSWKNRIVFWGIEDNKLKNLYNKLIDIFSKKEYSYSEVKNILKIVQDDINPQEESNEVTIEDILDKIPSNLLSDEIKEFFEENFDDLYSYFDDVFNPEELILKSPKDLANYFDFVYEVMNDERGLDITDWGEYFRDYYNRNI